MLVCASGELDLAAAPRLATVLSMAAASAEPAVVLDLSDVDFIDSTALGAIMHASTEAEAAGKRMLVVAIDGPVRRLLEITNLTGRFRVYPRATTPSPRPRPDRSARSSAGGCRAGRSPTSAGRGRRRS